MNDQPRNRRNKSGRRRTSSANTKAAAHRTDRRFRRRRLSLEPLESRLLLANRVIIDFTPDTIDGEYQVGRFLELFDGSTVSNANRFLNYNSDSVVNAADAQLAAKKIGNRVTMLLKDFADESDVDLRVLYTTNLTAGGDPGAGERKLADGQDSSLNNTYVIYVGSDSPLPDAPDLGFAHQAFQGENNEFYGYVFARGVQEFLAGGEYPWKPVAKLRSVDFTNNVAYAIAHELGHLWGLGHLRDVDATPANSFLPNQYHHIMNYPKQANPDLARFLDNSTHRMEVGSRSLGIGYQHVNAWDEVHDSLAADLLGFFDQETIPNDEFPVVPTYREFFGSPYEFGDANPVPAPVTTLPAASQGVRGTTTAAHVAATLNDGFATLRQDLLDDFAARLNLPPSALPLVSGDLADLLGLSTALTNAIGAIDVSGAATMAALQSQLDSAGFTVNVALTDAQLAAAAANQPIDFVRASRTYSLTEIVASSPLTSAGLGALADLAGVGLSGTLDVLADLHFTIAMGVDSAGFYLAPGNGVHASLAVSGNIDAALGGGGTIGGNASLGFATDVLLKTPHADGRVRLSDLETAFNAASELQMTGAAGLSLHVFMPIGSTPGASFGGDWIWDLDPAGQAFTLNTAASGFNAEELLDSLAEAAATGIQQMADEAANLARMAQSIPVIGDELAGALTPLIAGQLAYANELGSAREYLAERGFTITSMASPASFLDGSYLSRDLLLLDFHQTLASARIPLDVGGNLGFPTGGVDLKASFAGQLQFAPSLDFDFQFGVNMQQGVFLVEGSGIEAALPLTGNLTGSLNAGELDGIQLDAAANFATSASITLGDFDGVDDEKLPLGQFTVGSMLNKQPQAADPSGQFTLDLQLTADTPASDLPIVGKYLTNAISWTGGIQYDVDTKTGTYTIDENALPSFGDIEQRLRDEFLGLVDQYNPLPQNFRDFLTMKIDFLGSKSLADLMGFGSVEIFLNPQAYVGQAHVDVNEEDGGDHVTLNYDFATPANTVNLLLGKPASLFSLDIEKEIAGVDGTIPILPETPLATFFGIVNVTGQLDLTFGLSAAVDVIVGLDTNGFYLLDEADADIFSLVGSIGGELTIEADVVGVDFARITGNVDLLATGSVDVVAPDPLEPKVRVHQLFHGGQINSDLLTFDLALDLAVKIKGEVGLLAFESLTYETAPYEIPPQRLFELSAGGSQPDSDEFEGFREDLRRRVLQAGACSAAVAYPNPITVGACAIASAPDIAAMVDRGVDWVEDRWAETADAANELGEDISAEAKRIVDEIADFLGELGKGILAFAGVDGETISDLKSIFGKGDWQAMDPEEQGPTFTADVVGDTLYVNWLEAHQRGTGWRAGEDAWWTTGLPYGYAVPAMTVSANGWLALPDGRRYSVLEDDLTTAGYGDDIFVQGSDSKVTVYVPHPIPNLPDMPIRVPMFTTVRWNATNQRDESDVNFSADIFFDGRVFLKYGQGNTNLVPKVGVTIDGQFTPVASHHGQATLTAAAGLFYENPEGAPSLAPGNTLQVVPLYDLLDQADDGAAAFSVVLAGDQYVIDAPDFITSEPIAFRKYDCYKEGGCKKEYDYAGIQHPNRATKPAAGITRIVVSASNRDDRIAIGENVTVATQVYGLGGNDLLIGGGGPDTLVGGTGDDRLVGDSGDDTLHGDQGNDTLYGRLGNDTYYGGDGDDYLSDDIPGDTGNRAAEVNTLNGDAGDDKLFGSPGPDFLHGGLGKDYVFGADGNDTLTGDVGVVTYVLANEADYLDGGDGIDVVSGGVGEDLLIGGDGDDVLHGGPDNDQLFGDDRGDREASLPGIDRLYGEDGDDVLQGGPANDELYGGAGADILRGNQGNDLLVGAFEFDYEGAGDGNDAIFGGPGEDRLYGGRSGPGLRRFLGADGSVAYDVLDGGEQHDELHGGSGPDHMNGGRDDDDLDGDTGDDVLIGDSGVDTLHGGPDDDHLFGSENVAGTMGSYLDGGAGDDFLLGSSSIDTLIGGSGSDHISGLGGQDTAYGHTASGTGDDLATDFLYGDDGVDTLYGQGGSDELYGGTGDDGLFGGDGGDLLVGNQGEDDLDGGDGNDTVYGGDDKDDLIGGNGADTLHGDGGDDILEGYAGADVLYGGLGIDRLYGQRASGAGDDGSADILHGDDGDDLLYGQAGPDDLFGGMGADRLWGGLGNDRLFGELASSAASLLGGGDSLYGEEGDDELHGGGANDSLHGGLGADTLSGDRGNDRIDGGDGDDFASGGPDDDVIYGGAGLDVLHGDDGDDYLDGGDDRDTLSGGSGEDYLFAGAGIGDALSGDAGDDYLVGSDDGADSDPDFFDAVFFGDRLDGGTGDDVIFALGGADYVLGGDDDDRIDTGLGADYVLAGLGDDWVFAGHGSGDLVFGGAGDDVLYGSHFGADTLDGEAGRDRLYGQGGTDTLNGGADDDFLDGGADADTLDGGDGHDELLGGGGAGDHLRGGAGDDILRGSDDGADLLEGGLGRDLLMGNGGNDDLRGDGGDDTLQGGAGDDTLAGDAGSDLLVGQADHDTLYGHLATPTGDDGSVDYVYGDFGTNGAEPGAGRDRLFGQGGNDLLFGEGDDDLLDGGAGGNNQLDFGAGDGATPNGFVPPLPTPAPAVVPGTPLIVSAASLPSGAAPRGRWSDLFGAASSVGVSGDPALSFESTIASGPNGTYVAWVDARDGNFEIYVARLSSTGWEALGSSAGAGGISQSTASSRRPQLAIGTDGQPIVAWTEIQGSTANIFARRWDPSAGSGGQWNVLGGSASGGGISLTGAADQPRIVNTAAGPIVAWLDRSTGTANIYARRFNGTTWDALGSSVSGTGISGASSNVSGFALATNGTRTSVAWAESVAGRSQVRLREFNGASWVELNGSTSGNGISNSPGNAALPTAAYLGGDLFVAWQDDASQEAPGTEIYAARHTGSNWSAAGSGAMSGGGVSQSTGNAGEPQLTAGGGRVQLVWIDDRRESRTGDSLAISARVWNGSQFAEEVAGDASYEGVSLTAVSARGLAATTDSTGRPLVTWFEPSSSRAEIFARGNLQSLDAPANVFLADARPGQTLQAILDANDLGPGDTIVMRGRHDGAVFVNAQDSGVLIVGEPGATIAGTLAVQDAANVTLQRLTIFGAVTVTNATEFALLESQVGPVTLSGGAEALVRHVTVSGGIVVTGTNGVAIESAVAASLEVGAGVTAAAIRHNQFDTLTLSGPAAGTIVGNDLRSLDINAAFDGSIAENDIHDSPVGVHYGAAAQLSGNRIHGHMTGIVVQVTDPQAGLGFVGAGMPNEITENAVGIHVAAGRVQNQHVVGNTTGVTGSGVLGGDDLSLANVIEANEAGVNFTGTIQFNRLVDNRVGILGRDRQTIAHNLFDGNEQAGVHVDGRTDVRILQNSFYASTGDNVRIEGGSREVELRGNLLWAETGYDVFVANDSQTGFFSDYNALHSTGTGKLVHWVYDFTDLLDWQADLAKYDLHSIGTTVVNPAWSTPRFQTRPFGQLQVIDLVARQRFSSPTIDFSDPLLDQSLFTGAVNLLTNPGFEAGLSGWTTTATVSTGELLGPAFEGTKHLTAGETAFGEAKQTIDLLGAGFTAGQLDGGNLTLTFGGRIRSLDEEARDFGQLRLIFLNAAQETLATVSPRWVDEAKRWVLSGDRVAIPAGSRSVRFEFSATRRTGPSNDAALDNTFVYVLPESYAPDLGAWGATPTDAAQTFPTHVALQFPDLYVDWERDVPHDIRWQSVTNTVNSQVRIDLYQDGPDGPALVTNLTAATDDDGAFSWTPANSAVAYGTRGLRIHVSLIGNPTIFSRSTEPFVVPENTTTFFANDHSPANDEYTAAIGDNRHTGKLASAPKPGPAQLLRTYSLGPTHTLFVDTGAYDLFETIVLSGSGTQSDDEGFVFTGPTAANRTATLRHAIPSTRSLIELDDADFVTAAHLTLPSGVRGLWAYNGSTDFTGRYLTFPWPIDAGIRIESGSSATLLDHIVVTGSGGYGILAEGLITHLTNSVISGSRLDGIAMTDPGNVAVEGNEVFENYGNGITASNTLPATIATIGNANLALGRGNRVHDNLGHGIYTVGQTLVVGNATWGQLSTDKAGVFAASGATASRNIAYSNYHGLLSANGAAIEENRAYHNTDAGILVTLGGDARRNVVYSNGVGIEANAEYYGYPVELTNNLIYANVSGGIWLHQQAQGSAVVNNTIVQPAGNAITVSDNSRDVHLRNNILSVAGGYAVSVSANSQVGFTSDYNLFQATGGGRVANWQNVARSTLAAWQSAALFDQNSLSQDPRFVNPAGADGVPGYISPAQDGRDDDFHEQSLYGSFHGGAFAPVRDATSGLPVFLTATLTVDGAPSSAGIDRGSAGDSSENEPAPNGSFINLGAYGNTPQASLSPVEFVTLLRPDGQEVWPAEQTFVIRWRASTGAGTADIELVESDGADGFQAVALLADDTENDGEFAWHIPSNLVPGGYFVSITTDVNGQTDRSNAAFSISGPVSAYYVNIAGDVDLADNEYTTEPGDDGNDGLTPATPKASLAALLAAYDLEPHDIVYVDTGRYELLANIVIEHDDSGVSIQGPVAASHAATLDRANLSDGSYVFDLIDADDVTLSHLMMTGASIGIHAGASSDSDHLTVQSSHLFGNRPAGPFAGVGVQISAGNDFALISNNIIHDNGYQGIVLAAADSVAQDNRVFGHSIGIAAHWSEFHESPRRILGNVVFDNFEIGIYVSGADVRVQDNDVYGHQSWSYSTGIRANSATVSGNRVYGNAVGLDVDGSGGSAASNRVYRNLIGIRTRQAMTLRDNFVYSNEIGIDAGDAGDGFNGRLLNNLVYDNAVAGIALHGSRDGAELTNNTVSQTSGDAIQVDLGSRDLWLRNNILAVSGGYAVRVAADSQLGFDSDYNLFQLSEGGRIARWGTVGYAALEPFSIEVGRDLHSYQIDPGFIDPSGIDDLRGFRSDHIGTPQMVDDSDPRFLATGQWSYLNGAQGDFLETDSGSATIKVGPFAVAQDETGTVEYWASWPNYPGLGFATVDFYVSEGPAFTTASDSPDIDQSIEASTAGSLAYTAHDDGQIFVTLTIHGGPIHIDRFQVQRQQHVVALDDGSPDIELQGLWKNDHVFKNVHRVHQGTGAEEATWMIGGLMPGEAYALQALWDPSSVLSSNLRYEIWDGGTLVGLRYLDQNRAPSDVENVRIGDANLGFYRTGTGTLSVRVFAEAGANLLADAIRILHIPGDRGEDDNFHVAGGSPTVDYGDPQSYFLGERLPNGARANLGYDGNTAAAAVSLIQTLQIQSPNGGEKIEAGGTLHVDWISSGIVADQPVALINVGGAAVDNWLTDDYFTTPYAAQATAESIDLSSATNTAPTEVYQTYQQAPFGAGKGLSYQLPLPDGNYTVRLHFAEPWIGTVGERLFDVQLQGLTRADDFDIFAAGGTRVATIQEFSVDVAGGVGLNLALVNQGEGWPALLSALEVTAANPAGTASPSADVELSLDQGLTWTTIADDVPLDRYGRGAISWPIPQDVETDGHAALLQVRYDSRQDSSDRPFTIANGGTSYYVNVAGDTNLNDNEYTTGAGDDANSGKSPNRPMASLSALLRAYDLEPGDTIFVDTGVYTLQTNLVLGQADSGVTVQGPTGVGRTAVFDRDNTSAGSYVFELAGADDVTLSHLVVTGGAVGVYAGAGSDSDRLTVQSSHLFGNRPAGPFDGVGVQISAGNDFARISNNVIQDNGYQGIVLEAADSVAQDNRVFGHSIGIVAHWSGFNDSPRRILGNVVFENLEIGIYVSDGDVLVQDNEVYGHQSSSSSTGIRANSAAVSGNRVYGNAVGLDVDGSGGSAASNRVYRNLIGIRARQSLTLRDNFVYSNEIGIDAGDASDGFHGRLLNNLVYDNAVAGIALHGSRDGAELANNTVYQTSGDAIRIDQQSRDVRLRNNILSVGDGYALFVHEDSQIGFDSDYNLFHMAGNGKLAQWQTVDFTNLDEWAHRIGADRHSLVGDPQFADVDGADNALGFAGGIDRGADDNFRVLAGSPTIDRGDPLSPYLAEPLPNGGRTNVGRDGNTAWAMASPAASIQVLRPSGREKLEAGEPTVVQWLSHGLTEQHTIALVNAGGSTVDNWLAGDYRLADALAGAIEATDTIDLSGVAFAAPAGVYRTYDEAPAGTVAAISYRLPLPDGTYDIRLHFVEPWVTQTGQRVFDIALQGETRLDNFDLPAAAGGPLKALSQTFAVTVGGGAGLSIDLRNESEWPAVLSGIEITRVNPNGAANIVSDVDVSLDNGQTWNRIADDVPLDHYGRGTFIWTVPANVQSNAALVRVQAGASDISDAPLLIAPAGHDFYVNDGSLSGDIFTTAVGNNAHSGKSADKPMADLYALLSSYGLGPGDVVHVDSGAYDAIRVIAIDAQDAGVRIVGSASQLATLNRRRTASPGGNLFELGDADDVSIEQLGMTGAFVAVFAGSGSDSDRLHLLRNDLFGNSYSGVQLESSNSEARIEQNRIHDTGGATFGGYGLQLYGAANQVEANEVFGNEFGMDVRPPGGSAMSQVLRNTVHDNVQFGILASDRTVVAENRVYNHAGTSTSQFSQGAIVAISAEVRDNIVSSNYFGIRVSESAGEGVAAGNRVFDNNIGIWAEDGAPHIAGNFIYSNSLGIQVAPNSSGDPHSAQIADNLLYDNTNGGILVVRGVNVGLINNTIYQSVGDAIRLQESTENTRLANNILWVNAGYALSVASDSQTGLASDYNQFQQSADANAHVGFWNDGPLDLLADWQTATGLDAASLDGDPLFIDRNGADNRFGYDSFSQSDGGQDDNFHLAKISPAIDSGDSRFAGPVDLEGHPRSDDAGTPNAGRFTYLETPATDTIFQPEVIGIAQNWHADDAVWSLAMPFAFPFFEASYTSVAVSSNGLLQFGGGDASSAANGGAALATAPRIAALWDELRTDGPGDDIFIASSATEVSIRWNATNQANGGDVNFVVTLLADGRIRFDYGRGNEELSPTIGISNGDGSAFLASYDGRVTLADAAPRQFEYGRGFVDRGAYEFQGSVLDVTPPTVVNSQVVVVAGTPPRTEIHVTFSEAVDPIDARAPANYELFEAGPNGTLGDGDDVSYAVVPRYEAGSLLAILDVLPAGTILTTGRYQLVVHGDSTIHDLSGLKLDGDGDHVEGGNFIGTNRAPLVDLLTNRSIDERQTLDFIVGASDPDLDVLAFQLGAGAPSGATLDSVTGRFQWTPAESQAPGVYPITVLVSDNGSPSLSTTRSFTITAVEVNDAPIVSSIANQAALDGTPLTVQVSAGDPELATLTYSLDSPPAGATIDSSTGLFRWTPREAQSPATFTITVRTTDDGSPNRFALTSFDVVVAEHNDPPQWNPVSNRTIPEGVPASITLVAGDPEQGTLAYQLTGTIPAGASINSTTGVFNWTPSESQGPGAYTISVRAADNGTPLLFTTTSFTIAVEEVNATPSLDTVADQSVTAGAALIFPVVAADSDVPGNALTFSLAADAPAGAAIDLFTGVFAWTPTAGQTGEHSITVRVVDDGSPPRATTTTFLVTVGSSNLPPTISDLINRAILEDQSLAPVVFAVSDAELAPDALLVTATSNNPSLVPNANITLGGNGGNRTIAVQPLANRNGSVTITVTVSDGVYAVSDILVLDVTAVNDAPVLGVIGAKSVRKNDPLTFTVSATDVETPPPLLTLGLDAVSVGLGMTLDSSTGLFRWLPASNQRPGNYEVTVTVTDDGIPAERDAETFTITIVSWQNPRHPCDITGDDSITPVDVLTLINEINFKGSRDLNTASPATPTPPPFLDPTGDGWLDPGDVLIVINYINANASGPISTASGGEGEYAWLVVGNGPRATNPRGEMRGTRSLGLRTDSVVPSPRPSRLQQTMRAAATQSEFTWPPTVSKPFLADRTERDELEEAISAIAEEIAHGGHPSFEILQGGDKAEHSGRSRAI
jgi:parallel beta-helix repeat protein